MKVKELIERLNEFEEDEEVEFAVWNHETGQIEGKSIPIEDVGYADSFYVAVYLFDK